MPRSLFIAPAIALYVLLSLPVTAMAAETSKASDASQAPTRQTLASGLPMAPEQAAVVFEKADLQFKVDPGRKHLQGDAALTFKAKAPLQRLAVDLDRNFAIEAVEVDGQPLPRDRWGNPDGRLSIELPTPLAGQTRAVLRIRYSGSPHVAKKAPWDGGFVWSKAPTGEPWVATAVQGEGCDLFWPCIDHPLAEPLEVVQHITVPAPLVAAGNGLSEGMDEGTGKEAGWRTWHWRALQPNTYAIALNIGPYELLESDYRSRYGNTFPLRYWYLKGNREKAEGLFSEFSTMLNFFEEKIGPYPFAAEKMGVVETPHLGMEHQTINAYGNDYRKDENGYDWLLHHEFAHEWFGNQLTHADASDMWLHEGFGTYMQPLYLQWLRGDMEYMAALMKQRATLANKMPIAPGRPLTVEQIHDGSKQPGLDNYYKGSLILHTLRNLIGDRAFFAATRRLVYGSDDPQPGKFGPRHGSSPDFTNAVNAITGRDYDWFFDVYLRSAALPELIATREGRRLNLRWKTEADKPFPMPVQVRVGERVVTVPMRDGRGDLKLRDGESFTLDPHSKVLRELPHIAEFQADKKAREEAGKSNDRRPGQ